jgi:hypothetical protein
MGMRGYVLMCEQIGEAQTGDAGYAADDRDVERGMFPIWAFTSSQESNYDNREDTAVAGRSGRNERIDNLVADNAEGRCKITKLYQRRNALLGVFCYSCISPL